MYFAPSSSEVTREEEVPEHGEVLEEEVHPEHDDVVQDDVPDAHEDDYPGGPSDTSLLIYYHDHVA